MCSPASSSRLEPPVRARVGQPVGNSQAAFGWLRLRRLTPQPRVAQRTLGADTIDIPYAEGVTQPGASHASIVGASVQRERARHEVSAGPSYQTSRLRTQSSPKSSGMPSHAQA